MTEIDRVLDEAYSANPFVHEYTCGSGPGSPGRSGSVVSAVDDARLSPSRRQVGEIKTAGWPHYSRSLPARPSAPSSPRATRRTRACTTGARRRDEGPAERMRARPQARRCVRHPHHGGARLPCSRTYAAGVGSHGLPHGRPPHDPDGASGPSTGRPAHQDRFVRRRARDGGPENLGQGIGDQRYFVTHDERFILHFAPPTAGTSPSRQDRVHGCARRPTTERPPASSRPSSSCSSAKQTGRRYHVRGGKPASGKTNSR